MRLELEQAEPLLHKALELAEGSGSVRAQGGAKMTLGMLRQVQGRLDEAETVYEEVRSVFAEVGALALLGAALTRLALVAYERGDAKRAEKLAREAVRIQSGTGELNQLCDSYSSLALYLAVQGRVEEAETALAKSDELITVDDPMGRMLRQLALGRIRAAEGRDEEAEELLLGSLQAVESSDFRLLEREALRQLGQFLRERGRLEEAAELDERAAELTSTARIA